MKRPSPWPIYPASGAHPQGASGTAGNAEYHAGNAGSRVRPQRLLVADDETHVRDLAELVLGNSGFEVTCARDGEEAWLLLCKNHYDLLLTDRDMPRMNGLELVARARRQTPGLPIILMSGTAPAPQDGAWGTSKSDGFLPKPFTVAELIAKVNATLAKS